MLSMTGYGKGISDENGRIVTVEIKSVNNRYLDISSRVPKGMAFADDIIRRVIRSNAERGSFDVYYEYANKSDSAKKVQADVPLAREYYAASKKLSTEFVMENDVSVLALMRFPEVLSVVSDKDDEEVVARLTEKSAVAAMEKLNGMRKVEGNGIEKDLRRLIDNTLATLQKAILRAPEVVSDYREKLNKRMTELLGNVKVDENLLINEVAFFADKADINEEISRLSSHIDQFLKAFKEKGAIGRKLDFLSQEMVREINTMGSKSNDRELTEFVVAMKNEVEKIKEQIRNVE